MTEQRVRLSTSAKPRGLGPESCGTALEYILGRDNPPANPSVPS